MPATTRPFSPMSNCQRTLLMSPPLSLSLSDSSLFSDEEEEIDEAQGVPIPGLHDPTACLPPHHPPHPPHPPHHGGIHGGILPPSHMSPLPPPPPHMEHPPPPPPPPPGSAGPFFHGPGIPPAPPPGAGGPKLGETNNNSMEKDLHGGVGGGMGKGDEEESVDGDADNCKGEDSENKSPDDGAGGKRRGPRTTIKARTLESVRSSDGVKARRDRTSKDVNE